MAFDAISYALSKKYTEDTSDALGAVKGAPATIQSMEHVDGGTNITFQWTGTSGARETQVLFVADGKNGEPGTTDHSQLTNREKKNQHPIEAISGLEEISNAEILKMWKGG